MAVSEIKRARQRENRRIKNREEKLDAKNMFGIDDPTPQKAIKRMAVKN